MLADLHLPKDWLNDGFPTCVGSPSRLGAQPPCHSLSAGGVLGNASSGCSRHDLAVPQPASGDENVNFLVIQGGQVVLRAVASICRGTSDIPAAARAALVSTSIGSSCSTSPALWVTLVARIT